MNHFYSSKKSLCLIFSNHLCVVNACPWEHALKRLLERETRSDTEEVVLIEYKQMRREPAVWCCLTDTSDRPQLFTYSSSTNRPCTHTNLTLIQVSAMKWNLELSDSLSALLSVHLAIHYPPMGPRLKSIRIHPAVNLSSLHIHYQAAHVWICSHSPPSSAVSTELNLTWHVLHFPHALTFITLHNERGWHRVSVFRENKTRKRYWVQHNRWMPAIINP